MANVYVYSGAGGAGTGADWANAYTTLSAALSAKAAGDDFWVAHDHAESTASSISLSAPGIASSPNRIVCVNRAGSVPPVPADLRATATVATTGNNNITISGVLYCYGIGFTAGNSTGTASITLSSSSANAQHFENCPFALGSTGGSSRWTIGSGNAVYVLCNSCPITFSNASQSITLQANFRWLNTSSAVAGTAPSFLFLFGAGSGGQAIVEGVDLSAVTGTLALTNDPAQSATLFLKDVKLGAGVTVSSTPIGLGYPSVDLIRGDSADTNYRTERYRYTGTQRVETTIVRTGGASDGTTPISWKIVTTANSKRILPFECMPISIWNETVGSAITLTVQGIWGGGAVPTDADVWMDVEYLGTSGFPLGSFATSGPADQLASGTNLGAGSGTWGGSTTKFKLEKQITPQEKGPITVYIKAALASSTFYIDPKITVS